MRIITLLLLVLTYQAVLGQSAIDKNPYGFAGITVTGGLSKNSGGFSSIPNFFSCSPEQPSTWGSYFALGVAHKRSLPNTLSKYLKNKHFDWDTSAFVFSRVEYSSVSAPYQLATNYTVFSAPDGSGKTQSEILKVNNEFELSYSSISFGASLGLPVYKKASVIAGLYGNIFTSNSVSYREQILEPSNGVFKDVMSRTRNEQQGSLTSMKTFVPSFRFGAQYELPLSKAYNIIAVPELSFNWSLTDNTSLIPWSTNIVALGVTILAEIPYSPDPYIAPDTIPPLLTVNEKPKKSILFSPVQLFRMDEPRKGVFLTAVKRDSLLVESSIDTIRINGFYETAVRPVLPYVFFDENSSLIPTRFKQYNDSTAQSFSMNSLFPLSMIETYLQVLNIVGKRLNEIPHAKITLTGCNANIGDEAGKKELSQARAESVKSYLVDVWKVDPKRIQIIARNLPSKPSFYNNPDGDAENRRVEISSSIPQVLEPIFTTDTSYFPNPSTLYLKPNADATNGVRSWNLLTSTPSGLGSDLNQGAPLQREYEFSMNEVARLISTIDTSITFKFQTVDGDGIINVSDNVVIPIQRSATQRKTTNESSVEVYNLILFEFDKAEPTQAHEKLLQSIKSALTEDALVTITGYTDRMGDDDYNQVLSDKRARSIANALGVAKKANVVGLGETVTLYNNDSPEGRFYCRTIEIKVQRGSQK